jgi:hypothetical protein
MSQRPGWRSSQSPMAAASGLAQLNKATLGRCPDAPDERHLPPDQVPPCITCGALTACHRYAALKRGALS